MVGLRRRRRQLQISEPFNFKKETTILPGLTEDEITVLREKAAAPRLGIAHAADSFAYTDTPRLPPSRSTIAGPLSLSPPPRLSIPLPIQIPNTGRHGSGTLSLRSSSTATTGASSAITGDYLQPHGKDGMKSVSMNDLDLLLFGDPSGTTTTTTTAAPHQIRMGGGKKTELVMPMPMPMPVSGATKAGAGGAGKDGSASFSSGMISPLELDDSCGVDDRMDWDIWFDLQLGSPVSPLSPADGGRKGFM